jgi:hypothetical protein
MKSYFKPNNISKYDGDPTKIIYRSSWELAVMDYCDKSSKVISWSSESVVIPYLCATDKRLHRYYMDFKITYDTGQTYLVEVKPKSQVKKPRKRSKITKGYINEVTAWVKNQSKWKAAQQYAEERKWKFVIWTEEQIEQLGYAILKKSHK